MDLLEDPAELAARHAAFFSYVRLTDFVVQVLLYVTDGDINSPGVPRMGGWLSLQASCIALSRILAGKPSAGEAMPESS